MDGPLLVGHGLGKNYGGVIAVDDVDIEVNAGEILGLVGPNGAGKTTLVDLISGIQESDTGSLTIRGAPLVGSASRRARMGLARTFQHPQLALSLTVAENMIVGASASRSPGFFPMLREAFVGAFAPARAADLRIVEDVARELGIEDLERLGAELTLGEQRLVEVGRALCQNPDVLLLDEPFAGADSDGLAGIVDVVRSLRDRGHGLILVDHNVDLVAQLADRMLLLESGRVAFVGKSDACLASPEMRRVYFGATDETDASSDPDPASGDTTSEVSHAAT